jgi:hypothetical protein
MTMASGITSKNTLKLTLGTSGTLKNQFILLANFIWKSVSTDILCLSNLSDCAILRTIRVLFKMSLKADQKFMKTLKLY